MEQDHPKNRVDDHESVLLNRRKEDTQLQALGAILASVESLRTDIKKLDEIQLEQLAMKHSLMEVKVDIQTHVEREEGNWETAFVDGDADSHRRLHEAMIKKEEAVAEVWSIARNKMIDMTIYGIIAGLGIVFLYYWNGHVSMPIPPTLGH